MPQNITWAQPGQCLMAFKAHGGLTHNLSTPSRRAMTAQSEIMMVRPLRMSEGFLVCRKSRHKAAASATCILSACTDAPVLGVGDACEGNTQNDGLDDNVGQAVESHQPGRDPAVAWCSHAIAWQSVEQKDIGLSLKWSCSTDRRGVGHRLPLSSAGSTQCCADSATFNSPMVFWVSMAKRKADTKLLKPMKQVSS